jgi:hypothetical protein
MSNAHTCVTPTGCLMHCMERPKWENWTVMLSKCRSRTPYPIPNANPKHMDLPCVHPPCPPRPPPPPPTTDVLHQRTALLVCHMGDSSDAGQSHSGYRCGFGCYSHNSKNFLSLCVFNKKQQTYEVTIWVLVFAVVKYGNLAVFSMRVTTSCCIHFHIICDKNFRWHEEKKRNLKKTIWKGDLQL